MNVETILPRRRLACLVVSLSFVVLPPTIAGAVDPSAEEHPETVTGDRPHPPHDESFGPRGGRGFRTPSRRMMWERMTEEEKENLRQFIGEHFPQRYEMMMEVEQRDGSRFGKRVARVLPEMLQMQQLSEEDPELFEVRLQEMRNEFDLRRLARRYRFTENTAVRDGLESQIRPLVERQFHLRQKRHELEIARMERKLDRLRSNLARRNERRDVEIERAMGRILGDEMPPPPRHRGPQRWDRFRDDPDPDNSVAIPEP